MSSLIIKADVLAGSSIDEASEEAIQLAKHLNITIQFNFNGFPNYAYPSDTVQRLVTTYYNEIKRK